jgi:hypothetical protein
MPRRFTMGTLVTRFRQRANMENDDSISTSEWKSMGSEIYGELYEEVADSGLRYFESSSTFVTTGLAYLAEPADQLSMVDNLELVIDTVTGLCRRLKPIQPQERASLSGRTGDPRRYEMVDDRFYLYPMPPAGKTLTLRYIGQSPDLSSYADADVVDVVTAAGEAFLIWGVAAVAKSKDERFVDYAETQKEKARVRLQQWAKNRAFNEAPRRIVDDDPGDDVSDWWEGYYT